jgi:hypothetical protein
MVLSHFGCRYGPTHYWLRNNPECVADRLPCGKLKKSFAWREREDRRSRGGLVRLAKDVA